MVAGDAAGIVPLLADVPDLEKRLAIHQRNYETNLVAVLLTKFPASAWLTGTPFVAEAARHFAAHLPPRVPCIAEYGEEFPRFLQGCPGGDRIPYLKDFGELEWHVGRSAVAIE